MFNGFETCFTGCLTVIIDTTKRGGRRGWTCLVKSLFLVFDKLFEWHKLTWIAHKPHFFKFFGTNKRRTTPTSTLWSLFSNANAFLRYSNRLPRNPDAFRKPGLTENGTKCPVFRDGRSQNRVLGRHSGWEVNILWTGSSWRFYVFTGWLRERETTIPDP